MSLDLLRIDERLIHGQVVVGWGTRLGIDYWVVVDDALAESAWEQELYASAVPEGQIEFMTVGEAIAAFDGLDAREGRGGLLTRGVPAMLALAEAGRLEGRRVNVGGVHDGPGRRRLLDYLCLSETELAQLRRIAEHARKVTARDLPTAPEITLDELEAR